MDLEVAVVHGNYFATGGGEVVAEHLARTFDAPLYYGFGDPDAVPDNGVEHVGLFDDNLGSLFKDSIYFRDLYYAWAWQHVPELHDYDALIQSGNEMGWYVPPDDQVVVKYVHSTPRTPYDRFPDKGGDPVTRLYAFLARVLYQQNIPFPDQYVANSELVARRIRRYWGVDDVGVAYPPVEVDTYAPGERDDFYFTFSRLYETKRIDEVIEAFDRHPDKRLVVGGTGPDETRLKRIAGDNVEFRGYLSEDEKRDLLGRAKALVFAARNEDFGIVPIEAFASGTPVIGVRDGYTRHQIRDGENGLLYDRGADALADTVDRFEADGVAMTHEEIAAEADQYSLETFEERMRTFLEDAVETARVTPGER